MMMILGYCYQKYFRPLVMFNPRNLSNDPCKILQEILRNPYKAIKTIRLKPSRLYLNPILNPNKP